MYCDILLISPLGITILFINTSFTTSTTNDISFHVSVIWIGCDGVYTLLFSFIGMHDTRLAIGFKTIIEQFLGDHVFAVRTTLVRPRSNIIGIIFFAIEAQGCPHGTELTFGKETIMSDTEHRTEIWILEISVSSSSSSWWFRSVHASCLGEISVPPRTFSSEGGPEAWLNSRDPLEYEPWHWFPKRLHGYRDGCIDSPTF